MWLKDVTERRLLSLFKHHHHPTLAPVEKPGSRTEILKVPSGRFPSIHKAGTAHTQEIISELRLLTSHQNNEKDHHILERVRLRREDDPDILEGRTRHDLDLLNPVILHGYWTKNVRKFWLQGYASLVSSLDT